MPDQPSHDLPARAGNGKIKPQPLSGLPAVDGQTLADGEQTFADTEQTLADADQTGSDRDQTSADSDQLASDRDQAASDRDLAHGVDAATHEVTRGIRERTSLQRDQTAAWRLDVAAKRDCGAEARDVAAVARDQAAAARDAAMTQRDAAVDQHHLTGAITGAEILARAVATRKHAAQQRADAAELRAQGAADRAAAARDREQAAGERQRARADREALASALAASEIDPLTGARTRAAGLIALSHEIDRCRRTNNALAIAYVDVVGLKTVNDSDGHAAGDALLQGIVAQIMTHLRSYDLVIRLAGDEFICVMSNMSIAGARERFSRVAAALTAAPNAGAIRTGFAELLSSDESRDDLLARADRELIDGRHQ